MKVTYSTLILFFIAVVLSSCINNKENLEYAVDHKKIRLILPDNRDYIKYEEIVPVKFFLKGIKLNQLRIFGPGISISSINDSTLKGTIFVKERYGKFLPNSIKKDTLHIKILIVENKIKYRGEILVPLKR